MKKWALFFGIYGFFGILVGRVWYFHDENRRLSKRMHMLYDKNRNRKLDAAELILFLQDHGVELTEAQQSTWIQHVDNEEDGFDEDETQEVLNLFGELPTASESLKRFSDWSPKQIWLDVLLLGLTAMMFSLLASQAENLQTTMRESSWYTGFKLSMLRKRGDKLVDKSKEIMRKTRSRVGDNADQSELEALEIEKEQTKAQLSVWVKESQKYLEGCLRLQSRIDYSGTWWKGTNVSARDAFQTYGIYQERYVFGGIAGGFFDLNRDESYFGSTCYVCENLQTRRKELVRIFDVGHTFDDNGDFEAGGLFKSLNRRRTRVEHAHLKCYSQLVVTQQLMFLLFNGIYVPSSPPTDLAFIIDARGFPLSEAEGRFVFSKVASALHHMHEQQLVHGFLCLESVGIFGMSPHQYGNLARGLSGDQFSLDFPETVAVLDFGTADFYEHSLIPTQTLLADDFLSPEDMDGEEVQLTQARDQWRFGAALYTALTGELPFSQDCFVDGKWRRSMDRVRLATGMLKPDQVRWSALSDTCRELISGLLRKVPSDRLFGEAVIKHRWFTEDARILS